MTDRNESAYAPAIANAPALSFTTVVDLLQRADHAGKGIGWIGPVDQETILFRASASMGFPGGDVAAVTLQPQTSGWPAEVEVTFLGLYGPSSPMPAFWTERIVQDGIGAQNQRDFLDLFNHPLIALLDRITRHYRSDQRFDVALKGALPRALMALTGQVGDVGLGRFVDWARLLPYVGLMTHSARSASMIEQIVAGYFDLPIVIEEWVVRMVDIPDDQLYRLGHPQAALGAGTVLGSSTPDASGAIRLIVGPLPRSIYESFLPGGQARVELHALVHQILRRPIVVFVDLLLDATEAKGLVLGEGKLGWTTWCAGGDGPARCPTGPL